MSKIAIFAIYDTKAQAFGQPFFQQTAGLAARGFGQACLNTEGEFYKFPLDFTLYEIGVYDDETGKIESLHPMEICTAGQAIKTAGKEAQAYERTLREQQESLEQSEKDNAKK